MSNKKNTKQPSAKALDDNSTKSVSGGSLGGGFKSIYLLDIGEPYPFSYTTTIPMNSSLKDLSKEKSQSDL